MKKSLSLLLAIAMVFSLFAGVASAADNGKTALEKFNELKAKGIFAGIDEQGTPGLDQPMTRAQYARVAALILGLQGISPNGDTKVVTEKPFKDVELDAWFVEEVAAVKEAGIMVGNPDGTFNPNGNITVQELAVVTAQSLGLTPVEDAKVEGADDWAAGYIQALLNEGINFPTNYKEPATREQLVVVAYEMNQVVNPEEPEKVSVVSAKPIGVQKVEVKLDKAVDKSKATLTLKRGNTTVNTKAEFSADNKTAVLTLTETKINAGEYTVTLGGLDASEVANASAKFTAEDETVQSIEFVNASEWIPFSEYVTIKAKAYNQYGEVATLGAGNFTAFVLGQEQSVTKDSEGNLVVTFDITDDQGLGKGMVQGSSVVPVYIYYNENRVTAQKQFKLGTAPFLSKVEVAGDVKYSNGSALSAVDHTATIPLKLYDQYGNEIVAAQMAGQNPEVPNTINVVISPYSANVQRDTNAALFDDDGNARVIIKLTGKEDKNQEYTVTIYGGSSSATAKVNVGAAKLAVKAEFGDFNSVVAEGDGALNKWYYIPIIATDVNGEQLSAQDIVDNDKLGRFNLSGSNNITGLDIEHYGDKKGQVKFKLDNNSAAAKARNVIILSLSINTPTVSSFDQTTITIQPARYPDSIAVKTEPEAKTILGAGGKFQFIVKDQYGEEIKDNLAAQIPNANGQNSTYQIKVTVTGDTATSGIVVKDGNNTTLDSNNSYTVTYSTTQITNFTKEFTFTSDATKTGKVTVKAVIQRQGPGQQAPSDFSAAVSRTIEAIKADSDLTYTIADLGSTFAYIDKKPGKSVQGGTTPRDQAGSLEAYYDVTDKIFESKKIKVEARDSAGNKVALPAGMVRGISTSDATVAQVYYDPGTQQTPVNEAWVLGNKAGTATITVIVYTNKGETLTIAKDITVSADPIKVESITAEKTSNTRGGATNALTLFGKLTVKDQYGKEYVQNGPDNKTEVSDNNDYLGLRFSVSNIVDGQVTIDAETGDFVGQVTAKEFVVTLTAPSGKSVSLLVTN